MKKSVVMIWIVLSIAVYAQRPNLSEFQQKVKTIMEMEHRSEANKKRDRNRDPVRALAFLRMRDDMKVLEFMPGNGWYTEILGPLLKDRGELIIGTNPDWISDDFKEILKLEPMSKVKIQDISIGWDREIGGFAADNINLGVDDLDMVLSIREYHGFKDEGAIKFNKLVYDALKPGGYYAIIDHTRRHMEGDNSENGRRRDPVKIIKHLLDAGFEFVDYSDMFFRPDDELRYEVGRRTVTGNTDRFTFLFQKPEN
jgi:predicted methyltransferase